MYTNKFIQLNSTSSTVDSSSYIRKSLKKLNKTNLLIVKIWYSFLKANGGWALDCIKYMI
jgi:hypothetical protein